MSIFRLREKRELAARLVAADRLNDVEIAAQIGVTDRQLRRWKQKPEFRSRVEKHQQNFRRRWGGAAPNESDEGGVGRLTGGLTAMELARSRLTGVQLEAALLVALDELCNVEIGRKCGVSGRCIEKETAAGVLR